MIVVAAPKGGRPKNPTFNVKNMLKNKRSLISITATDSLCLGRALVVAREKALVKKGDAKAMATWESIRKGRCQIQKSEALALYRKAGVTPGPCDISHLEKFQKVIGKDYGINVFSLDTCPQKQRVFRGDENAPIQLYLSYWKEHYDVVVSITGFLNRTYFCESCGVGYNDKTKHKCTRAKCFSCMSSDCTGGGKIVKSIQSYIECNLCHRFFKDNDCLVSNQAYVNSTIHA